MSRPCEDGGLGCERFEVGGHVFEENFRENDHGVSDRESGRGRGESDHDGSRSHHGHDARRHADALHESGPNGHGHRDHHESGRDVRGQKPSAQQC